MANTDVCPTCGAPAKMTWSGLDLVSETGDETLATKNFTYQPPATELDKNDLTKGEQSFENYLNRLYSKTKTNNIGKRSSTMVSIDQIIFDYKQFLAQVPASDKRPTMLDLADAQFIGFKTGKSNWDGIIDLIVSMGMTKEEWESWKSSYPQILNDTDFITIEEYFKRKDT